MASYFNNLLFLPLSPGVPSPPSAITLLLCTGSEMVLGWRAPAHNGGDPVRGYYLDQREQGMSVWREVNVKPATERKLKVSLRQHGHLEVTCSPGFPSCQLHIIAKHEVGPDKGDYHM